MMTMMTCCPAVRTATYTLTGPHLLNHVVLADMLGHQRCDGALAELSVTRVCVRESS